MQYLLHDINEFIYEHLPMLDRSKETINGYKNDLYMFNDWLMDNSERKPTLQDIHHKLIEKYLFYLKRQKNYADTSRLRQLHCLSSFMNYAVRENKIKVNPCTKVSKFSVSKKERHALTEEEVLQMVQAAGDKTFSGVLISTLYYTGMRISELCNLTLNDVSLSSNTIHIKEGKGKKDRIIPISPKLKDILTFYLDSLRPKVFSKRFFATSKTGKFSQVYARYLIKEVERKLGWEKNITCHILRHSTASNLLRKGVSLLQIQKLLGHSSLRTTEIYLHTNAEELHEAVSRL
ncbi:tyrosine-type recombinase/integrase [Fictibacillus sp. WQ 8-8]|uniref:tyrosine-type recombinase/integrase n=1 Tax=Fictibacillus sp. WQ 8-8 TaxID=2938788 RepID=UPI00210EDB3D|nr:tyrosine-type recombinase/integrase [Fictibacillus sp. WQ 8-8]MCQ6264505.1 tyrosine-type recombinase/integrase [Fictibacillus sp. WQ 8-8]